MQASWDQSKFTELTTFLDELRKMQGEKLAADDMAVQRDIELYESYPWWRKLVTDHPKKDLGLWRRSTWESVNDQKYTKRQTRYLNQLYDKVNLMVANNCSSIIFSNDDVSFLREL